MIFFESNGHSSRKRGSIEVICGSMFSGKTEELIRRLKRAKIAKKRVEIFKPTIDNRYSETDVVSHDNKVIPSTPVGSAQDILLMSGDVDVIGIDEAQFFDQSLVDVCTNLSKQGYRIIIAGLDIDFKGVPFGVMPQLMAIADDVTKVHAICVRCGEPAYISHRLIDEEKQVLTGASDIYEPICRSCFNNIDQH